MPATSETCNGLDDTCDGVIDGFADGTTGDILGANDTEKAGVDSGGANEGHRACHKS